MPQGRISHVGAVRYQPPWATSARARLGGRRRTAGQLVLAATTPKPSPMLRKAHTSQLCLPAAQQSHPAVTDWNSCRLGRRITSALL